MVKIRNFVHKGLKRLYEETARKAFRPNTVDKLRKMLAFLDDMPGPRGITLAPCVEGTHPDRRPKRARGALSVTRNRRLTFFALTPRNGKSAT